MHVYTTRQIADLLGTDTWRIRRLYEDGTLPPAERIGVYRAIPATMIPTIIAAMQARGWHVAAAPTEGATHVE